MNPILSILTHPIWKRGEIHPKTGLVFWKKSKTQGEYWVSRERFQSIKESNDQWRKENRDNLRAANRREKKKNAARCLEYNVRYSKERRKTDPIIAMKTVFRNRTAAAFRKRKIAKYGKTSEILGCSWEELKSHIQRQFKRGMTWENRGIKWHVDHMIPLAAAKSPDELKRLCHYTNLRPMWAAENLAKGDKEITHQMALL